MTNENKSLDTSRNGPYEIVHKQILAQLYEEISSLKKQLEEANAEIDRINKVHAQRFLDVADNMKNLYSEGMLDLIKQLEKSKSQQGVPESVEAYISRVLPCEKPCDTFGMCDNCSDAHLIRVGASLFKKSQQGVPESVVNGLVASLEYYRNFNYKNEPDDIRCRACVALDAYSKWKDGE